MQHIDAAKKLIEWLKKNTIHEADLKKSDIAEVYAPNFKVRANGRNYDANYDNYFDFLNQFRSTIRSIDYDLHYFISDSDHVVIPLTAHILRTNGEKEDFEAILILKFNQQNKVVLWHEVYTKIV